MDLNSLMATAEAATPGPWQRSGVRIKMNGEQWHTVGPDSGWVAAVIFADRKAGDLARSLGDAGYMAAFHPEVAKALIRVAKAAQALLDDEGTTTDLALALHDLEAMP